MSYNAWLYVYANPVNNIDPSGMAPAVDNSSGAPKTPRLPGVCAEPPPANSSPLAPEFMSGSGGGINDPRFPGMKLFIYCGEFSLSTYEFVDGEDEYDQNPKVTVTLPGGKKYQTSAKFIADAANNGTGFSQNASLLSVCRDGYFHSINMNTRYPTLPTEANILRCGRGGAAPARPLNEITDADKAVAAPPGFNFGDVLFIPNMWPAAWRLFEVLDRGGAIQGFRLDIFAGQGAGPKSSLYGTSAAAQASASRSAHGVPNPASVYQVVPPQHRAFYEEIACQQEMTP